MTYSITSSRVTINDLGVITSENRTKDAQLFQMPIPRQDSNNAVILDIFGVSKEITINGTYTGTASQIKSFITSIESLSDGQQVPYTFTSDRVTGTTLVLVSRVKWDAVSGAVNQVDYTLTLVEAKNIS